MTPTDKHVGIVTIPAWDGQIDAWTDRLQRIMKLMLMMMMMMMMMVTSVIILSFFEPFDDQMIGYMKSGQRCQY